MDSAHKSRPRIGWPGLVGILISIALLWWTLHDVSLSEVLQHARGVRAGEFLFAIFLATLAFPLRTVRWRYLLQVNGRKLPSVPLWHATAIGFMANNLLPARAGEVARIYAAGKLTEAPYSATFASVAVERVFDGIVLLALMIGALAAGGFSREVTLGGASIVDVTRTIAIALTVMLVVAIIAVYNPGFTKRVFGRLAHRVLPVRFAAKVENLVEGLLSGLDSLRSPARLSAIVFWSVVVWLVNGASFYFGFRAFDLDLPISAAYLLQGVIALGIAIPSSPGYVGVFEAAILVTLSLYDVPNSQAVSYAVVYHIGGFIPITLLGLYSLGRAHLHLSDLAAEDDQPTNAKLE